MAEKGYAGKIANTGNKEVQAPNALKVTKGKSAVQKGTDLRAKK